MLGLHTRAQSLFRDLAMARADGSLRSLLVRLARIDVLVIDDWPEKYALAGIEGTRYSTLGRDVLSKRDAVDDRAGIESDEDDLPVLHEVF